MLTLVINSMTGLVVALVISSLIQSARAFLPAWKRLHAEVARLERGSTLHVSLREAGPADVARLTTPLQGFGANSERPAVTPVSLNPRNGSAFRSPLRHAVA